MDDIEISRDPIRPVECLREGWNLIKDQILFFVLLNVLTAMISSALAIVLWGPMVTGLFHCYLRKSQNKRVELSHLFKGFDLFGRAFLTYLLEVLILVMVGLVLFVPVVGLFIALMVSQQGAPGQVPNFGLILALITFYVLAIFAMNLANVFFVYSFPLLIDRGLEPIKALQTSARAVWQHLGGQLTLMILSGLLMLVGFAFCCVGVLFVIPVVYAAEVVAYRRMFPEPPPPDDELEEMPDDDTPIAKLLEEDHPHGFRTSD